MSRFALAALALVLAAPAGAAASGAAIVDGAFRDAQMALSSRTALALSRAARRLSSDPEERTMLRGEEEAGLALAVAESADAAARSTGRDPAAASAALAAARARMAAVRGRDPGVAPLGLAAAQAILGPGEALLLIQPTADGTFLFALDRSRVIWRRSPLTAAALAGEVTALRRAIDPQGLTRSGEDAAPLPGRRARAFPRTRAWQLYGLLWRPAAAVLDGKRTVYIVAGGAAAALPLGLLVTVRPRGADGDPAALRRTSWLIRRHALAMLPSVANLRALRAGSSRGRATAVFAGYGAPIANPAAPLLPPLPGSGEELARLARALGATRASVTIGPAATVAAVRAADLSHVSVLAFATHGLLAGEVTAAGEPALVLSPTPGAQDDGLLTASEAATLTLDADWVVLSACNTAAGDPAAGGEGLSGLARGFFSAGARAVLASAWRVRDDAVEALTVGTLVRWRRDPAAGRAAALRGAMLAMIADRSHPERSDPAYWAALMLAGEGR